MFQSEFLDSGSFVAQDTNLVSPFVVKVRDSLVWKDGEFRIWVGYWKIVQKKDVKFWDGASWVTVP